MNAGNLRMDDGNLTELDGAAVDYELILDDYRRRQMQEHLLGPAISLLTHVLLIIGCMLLINPTRHEPTETVQLTIVEEPVKVLEQPLEPLPPDKLFPDEQALLPTLSPPRPATADADPNTAPADPNLEAPGIDNPLEVPQLSDVKPSEMPLRMKIYYGSRGGAGRAVANRTYGDGSTAGESAVIRALEWLKRTQRPDGAWSKSSPAAMAGLGLLTFLAHGELPRSERYGITVTKSMQWLANAAITLPDRHQGMGSGRNREDPGSYTHGIVAYALAEGYGMTRLPLLKAPAEKMLHTLIRGQQRHSGGWDYNFAQGARADLSLSSWMIQAMKAAYIAELDVAGLTEAMNLAADFVQRHAFNTNSRRFRYAIGETAGGGTGSSWGMQGVGALCLQLLGRGTSAEARAAVESIANLHAPAWNNKDRYHMHNTPLYDWYYEVQAVFHGGMQPWRKWQPMFQKVLVENQHQEGYWTVPGEESSRPEFEKWYSTNLACLTLMVHYRNLPSYQEPKFEFRQRAAKPSLDTIDAQIE